MPNFSLKDQVVFEAARQFATPFHLYSERGIRQTARALKDAFGEIEDFREYFAVKALPTPAVLRILKEEGCGVDCASATELMLADACGFQGGDIMFSANDVTGDEFALARRLGAYINLDDITHVDTLAQNGGVPETVRRYSFLSPNSSPSWARSSKPCAACAASSSRRRSAWAYMRSVTLASAWPMRVATATASMLFASSMVACVCRRSWKRVEDGLQ